MRYRPGCSFNILIEEESSEPGEYCESKGDQPWQQWISYVSFGNINNSSAKDKYGDCTSQNTSVVVDETYPFSLIPGFSWNQWDEYIRVWIDFNQDGDFTDPGETVAEGIYSAGAGGSTPNPFTAKEV